MRIHIDSHTHSVASGHAYSTIDDLARGARRRGLAAFVLTDHGPGLAGGTHLYHFTNQRILPERIHGVRFLKGIEANLMDRAGSLDMELRYLARLDFVLAGLHEICLAPGTVEENTAALLAALRHPGVDAISHPGNPSYPIDARAVVGAAAEYGKAIEINNSSFKIRRGSDATCLEVARLCVEHGARIVCGSDAHYWKDVGRFDAVKDVLKAARVPKELVLSASVSAFFEFLAERKRARAAAAEREAAAAAST